MNYIFLDLEYNQPSNIKAGFKFAKYMKNEIIEIGAIKTTEKLELISSFKCYIKPYLQPQIKPEILKLMGFKNQEYIMTNGVRFKYAMKLFKNFIGNENFKFVVWGGINDINILKENCGIWKVGYKWFKNRKFIDVQQAYMKLIGVNQMPSLEKTLANLEIEKNPDKLHGALNDCFYTLHVARKIGIDNLFEYVSKEKLRIVIPNDITNNFLKKKLHCPKCGRFVPKGKTSKTILIKDKGVFTYRNTFCDNCKTHIFQEIKSIKKNYRKNIITIEKLKYIESGNKEALRIFYDKIDKFNNTKE